MTVVVNLIKRNLKLFFRDRASVFFSFLVVFIIIGLYAMFLGNMMVEAFKDTLGDNARFIINSWIMAGILSVVSITTTLGAFGVMVDDKTKNILKDFLSAPFKRSQLAAGYVISSFIVGVIMSIVALIVAEIYIVANGGSLLGFMPLLKLFGVMLLSVFAGTSMVFFIVNFFRSSNAYSVASSVIGTLIGFLTGIYIPIGQFTAPAVQAVIKSFPISHAASLFRQIMMEAPMSKAFANAPAEAVTNFERTMGVTFFFGGKGLSPLINILVLIVTGVVFLVLAIISMSVKKRQ
jgi:multidrug/hemolysin transport system permease protein